LRFFKGLSLGVPMTELNLPERLNAAEVFVDRHLDLGREQKAAILYGDEQVSYGRLHENVNRMGNLLRQLGVRIEERVAILLPDSPEWVYAFYGSIKIGAVAVPMNTMLTSPDYEYLLNDSRARVLIVDAGLKPKIDRIRGSLRYLEHVLVAGGSAAGEDCLKTALAAAEPRLAAVETSKDDMAFWLYSSGTTGFPKGAIHLHHDMIVEADLYAEKTIGLREDDLSFSVARLFFAYGLGNGLYFPLRLGGTTVLYSDRPTPEAVFGVIDRYRPTVFYGVPTSYAAMLHLAETTGRSSLGRVRMCVSAGEPLPSHLFEKWLERFGVEILDGIGSTEILHIFISNRPGRARAGSTGQIVPGYEAKIVDDNGNEVPQRTVGTLLIKGDSIAAGYWNKHEQTQVSRRRRRLLLVRRADRRHDEGQRPGRLADGRRSHPAEAPGRARKRRGGRGRQGRLDQALRLRRSQGQLQALSRTGEGNPGVRQEDNGPAQVPPCGGLRRGASENGDRQDSALQVARNRRYRDPAAPLRRAVRETPRVAAVVAFFRLVRYPAIRLVLSP
jgi:benzoate-CoA ligase family protein